MEGQQVYIMDLEITEELGEIQLWEIILRQKEEDRGREEMAVEMKAEVVALEEVVVPITHRV